jgi:hypothetical protein
VRERRDIKCPRSVEKSVAAPDCTLQPGVFAVNEANACMHVSRTSVKDSIAIVYDMSSSGRKGDDEQGPSCWFAMTMVLNKMYHYISHEPGSETRSTKILRALDVVVYSINGA